jgi:hypothetical protein
LMVGNTVPGVELQPSGDAHKPSRIGSGGL